MTQHTSPPSSQAPNDAIDYLQTLHARRVQAVAAAPDLVPVLNVELDLVLAWLQQDARDEAALETLAYWCARAAASAAAALLAQRFDVGTLDFQWPGEPVRTFEVMPPEWRPHPESSADGRDGAVSSQAESPLAVVPTLAPGRWVQALAAAWIVRDAQALAVLTDVHAIDAMFSRLPENLAPARYRRPWCELLAALERGEARSSDALRSALAADCALGTALDPQWLHVEVFSVLPLLEALGDGDEVRAADGLATAQTAHDRRDEGARPAPPLLLTGLRALAFDHRMLPAGDDGLAPLIRGALAVECGSMAWRFAPKAVARTEEIHWYFDLLGAPREGREHRLDQRGDALLARCRLPGWSSVPGAEARFLVRDDARLLDAAQLVAVADRHAEAVDLRSDADLPAQRACLAEAVAALELAQTRTTTADPSAAGGRLTPSALASACQAYRASMAQIDARLARQGP
ncbi:MAG: hypothetical protein ACOY82_03665 [Pseudomonadota bacterium]